MNSTFRLAKNGDSFPLEEIPHHELNEFLQTIINSTGRGWRVINLFGTPDGEMLSIYAVLGARNEQQLGIMRTTCAGQLPSITDYVPQLHLFEREIGEEWGVVPEEHPWFKPVRFIPCRIAGRDAWGRSAHEPILPCVTDYYRVSGEEIHEVAVGPVHAGIIEPGHFRFQCHGEKVFHLEIALGYQHRGAERALTGGPHPATLHQMETVAGDTTIGHAQAHCMLREALGGASATERGDAIRGIALELERLANHSGDLGALAGDVGYLPTMSYCGRIRGDFLNMSAVICGSRFGRGLVRPGGTGFDISPRQVAELQRRLAAARADLENAVNLLWHSSSAMARFEDTGRVKREDALELGLVGPAARACGIMRDVRSSFPFGIYRSSGWEPATDNHGDVYARAMVRWLEAQRSMEFIANQLDRLPAGDCRLPVPPLQGGMMAVAMTEGWRGEICHCAITDEGGKFAAYKIVDPSFHNWTGLALAMRGEQISDFPLCNKSFNLSYCGFDL
ncbi:MAG TPA: hydrogenase [Geobacteraceae bacterium]|nr:hydrogenase [Geobacteraceae bacterium]